MRIAAGSGEGNEESNVDSWAGVWKLIKSVAAGGIAGVCAKSVVAPFDRVKIIFQVIPGKTFTFRGALRHTKRLARAEGVASLWRGNSATILRVFPYAGIQFASFSQYKKALTTVVATRSSSADGVGSANTLNMLTDFVAGAGAGMTSVILTYMLSAGRSC